ncbi:hypothetical protein ACQ4PT_003952 [Festuca glaucescens]
MAQWERLRESVGCRVRRGDRSSYFSIGINHGGYFLGTGTNRSYVNGAVIWYDNVDSLTWSPLMLENIIEEIGYEMSGRIKVYYCIPMLSLSRNGLRVLATEYDTNQVITFQSFGHNFIALYLDHDESLRARDWDDVVDFPVVDMPPVVSPAKPSATEGSGQSDGDNEGFVESDGDPGAPVPLQVVYADTDKLIDEDCIGARTRQRKRKCSDVEEEEGEPEDDKDSDFDPEDIVDSDVDISEDDDDLFEDNVDDEEQGKKQKAGSSSVKGKEKVCKEEYVEEEDLWALDSDEEAMPHRGKTFREVDLVDPKFQVGLIFGSVELLRKANTSYSCLDRKEIKLPVNDSQRLKAVCSSDCCWYMWASYDTSTECFRIKKFNGKHTCSGTFDVHGFSSKFLAKKYVESFRADQDMNMKNFSRVVQKEWNMTPGRSKLQRARRLALKMIYGDEEAQYNMLWDYANEIRRSNPGSSFFLSLDEKGRFKRCYMSLQACKLGFLEGCRPIIFVDGCHIKTRYRGQLLTAVGVDPNNCIYAIAIAAIEVEDTANWTWFLEILKSDLGIINTTPWTIMSDKQKGLINAVRQVFPDEEHRFCVRHMWQNFQQLFRGDVLKNLLWRR